MTVSLKKISSRHSWFSKRGFPLIWFGILGFIGASILVEAESLTDLFFPLVVITIMATMGYLVMKHLVFDLCDEAWDAGTHLVFRKGDTVAEVDFANIRNVSYAMTSPPRVTLALRKPCTLGDRVVFSPPPELAFFGFKEPKIVGDLLDRVDLARASSTKTS